jgi:hypothetical protein
VAEEIESQDLGGVTKAPDKHAKYRAKNREKRRAESAVWWAENGAAYRAANREKLRAHQAKYREANRDLVRSRCSKFRKANPEKQRQFEQKYRASKPDRRKASCAAYRSKPENKEKEKITRAIWAKANLDKLAAKSAARRAQKLRATPPWANLDAIEAIYAEARRLTAETGIEHHVDHIYPLKSKWTCGLHCEANLQILVGPENLSKSNQTWPGHEWCTS